MRRFFIRTMQSERRWARRQTCLLLVAFLAVSSSNSGAQTVPLPNLKAPAFVPFRAAEPGERADELLAALDALDGRLARHDDPAGWRAYFGTDTLRTLLSEPSSLGVRSLAAQLPALTRGNSRSDWPEVTAVRDRLRALIVSLETAAMPDLAGEYRERAEKLITAVQRHNAHPQSDTAAEIGRQITWMRLAGQGRELIEQIRGCWSAPNFLAELDGKTLVPHQLDEPVKDRSPVKDNILGTEIRGQAETRGTVSMRLIPSRDSGLIELELRGTTVANTVGQKGPATMQSVSRSDFSVTTQVKLTSDGLEALPPQAKASLRSDLRDLQVQRRLLSGMGEGRSPVMERFARNKAEELKPEADQIAARRSEARYEATMSKFVADAIAKTNGPYREKFQAPLARAGGIYESLRFSSTADAMYLRMLYANGAELGADTRPPAFTRKHALSFKLHESVIRNAGQMLLRGATVSDRQLAGFMKGAFGEIPREAREYRLGSHLEPWSVTLANDHPLLADFDAAGSTVGLRISRVNIAGQSTPVDLRIVATYEVQSTQQGPRLTRIGRVEVAGNPDQVVQPSTEVLEFLRRKAEGFFISEIYFDGLVPPAGGPFDRYAQLSFDELIVRDGWIAMGFSQTGKSEEQTAHKPVPKTGKVR